MTTSVSTRTLGTLNPTRQQLDELDALLQRMLELPVNKVEDAQPSEAEDQAEETPPPPAPARASAPPPPLPSPIANAPGSPRPSALPMAYVVVETASPRPLPRASGFEPRPSALAPRLVPVTPLDALEKEPEAAAPVEPSPVPTPAPEPAPEAPPQAPPTSEETWVPLRSTWQPSPQTWPPLADSWHQAKKAPPEPLPSPHLETMLPREEPAETPAPVSRSVLELDSSDTPAVDALEPKESPPSEAAPASEPLLLLPLLWFNQGFDACLAPLGAPGRWLCGPRGRQVLGIVGLTSLAAAIAIAVHAGMGWTW
jgi:uncharacterized coiled-coil protein SlyX